VVCCRVSPQQKADVVSMVKNRLKVVTMAIGDGANDVAMIQQADVGVGINGLEGRQAVMASDYAISRFKFLARLTLVHGRWCYLRAAEMTLIFFYKNFVFVFPMFWYQSSCLESGQMVYDFVYQMFYNLVFTALPVIVLAAFDQEVSDSFSMHFPRIFELGIKGSRFNRRIFWLYIFDGWYQSVICYLIPLFLTAKHEVSTIYQGWNPTLFQLGTTIVTCVVLCANLTVAFQVKKWNFLIHAGIWLSILAFFLFHILIDHLTHPYSVFTYDLYYLGTNLFRQPTYWLTCFVTVVIALLPRFIVRCYRELFNPSHIDLVRFIEIAYGDQSDKLDEMKVQMAELKKAKAQKAKNDKPPTNIWTQNWQKLTGAGGSSSRMQERKQAIDNLRIIEESPTELTLHNLAISTPSTSPSTPVPTSTNSNTNNINNNNNTNNLNNDKNDSSNSNVLKNTINNTNNNNLNNYKNDRSSSSSSVIKMSNLNNLNNLNNNNNAGGGGEAQNMSLKKKEKLKASISFQSGLEYDFGDV